MVLQTLALMSQALGLGGFPNFARHEFGWFQALGFRMGEMLASQYLGANRLISTALRLLGRDQPVPYPLGLERGGGFRPKPLGPPNNPSREAAVQGLEEGKFGPREVSGAGRARAAGGSQ